MCHSNVCPNARRVWFMFLIMQNVSAANIHKQLISVYGENIMSCQLVGECRRQFLGVMKSMGSRVLENFG